MRKLSRIAAPDCILRQLRRWTVKHVLLPARLAYESIPDTYRERCDECDGSGKDSITDDDCMYCEGWGYMTFDYSWQWKRKRLDALLRRAGLNPEAFDDCGRLILETGN